MASKLKLFKSDILVTKKDINEVSKSSIIMKLKEEQDEAINFFEVLGTGENVKEVNTGDTVLIRFAEHTPPFEWDGKQVAITDESKIEGVIEYD